MDIHWPTRVITVYKTDPYMSFTGGNVYNMDTNGFRLALKDKEDDPEGISFPDTHRHNTTVLLGGIEYARILEIINGYTITFDDTDGAWVCNLIGSNNNILDVANLTSAQIRSNNSAGLTQMVEIQYASFQNGVWVDQANGTAGTTYPIGTARKPVSNFADAGIIAAFRGFTRLYILGNATMGADAQFANFEIVGQSASLTLLYIEDAANVVNCEIRECYIQGTLDNGTILRECMVSDLLYVNGVIFQCMLNPGHIKLGGGPMAAAFFLDCYSGVPSPWNPIHIDCGGDGPSLAIRGHNGGLQLHNKTGLASISIDMNSGFVELADTVTAGAVLVRGVGRLLDNSNGATVDGQYMMSGPATAETVWAHATALKLTSDAQFLRDIEGGRWRILNNQMIFYKEDNLTEVTRFDLLDADGAPTMTNPYERLRA